jgi:hypothetical protein
MSEVRECSPSNFHYPLVTFTALDKAYFAVSRLNSSYLSGSSEQTTEGWGGASVGPLRPGQDGVGGV